LGGHWGASGGWMPDGPAGEKLSTACIDIGVA